jgi:hypothetical protein
MITDRDLCCSVIAQGLDQKKTTQIAKLLAPLTCREGENIETCERLMQEHPVRRIPIGYAEDRVIGMISGRFSAEGQIKKSIENNHGNLEGHPALRRGLASTTAAMRPPWFPFQISLRCLRYAARSLTSADVADLAQWAQQKNRPPTSTPCPITLHLQCSQIGAIAWIAHSKLSKVCRAPAAVSSKLLSYSLPQTSQVAIGHLLHRAQLLNPTPTAFDVCLLKVVA